MWLFILIGFMSLLSILATCLADICGLLVSTVAFIYFQLTPTFSFSI